jgi:hypothetical protein
MEGALHNIAFLIRWNLGWPKARLLDSYSSLFLTPVRQGRMEGGIGMGGFHNTTHTHTLYYNINLASRDGQYGIWTGQRGTGQKTRFLSSGF